MNPVILIPLSLALLTATHPPKIESPQPPLAAFDASVRLPVTQEPLRHNETIKIGKGRYVSVDFVANADGTCFLTFKAKNMVAAAGCHAVAYLDLLDVEGNILARIAMPKLGLKPAWFSKDYTRQVSFDLKLTRDARAQLASVRFAASEDCGGAGLLTELRDAVTSLRQR